MYNKMNTNRCSCMLLSQLTAFYNCNTISGCVCVFSAYVAMLRSMQKNCVRSLQYSQFYHEKMKRNDWVARCSHYTVQLVHIWLEQERQRQRGNNVKWQIARRQHQRLLGWSFYGEAMVKLAAQAHAENLQVHTFAWVYLIRARKAQTIHDS